MSGRRASPAGACGVTGVAIAVLLWLAAPCGAQRLPFTIYTSDDGLPATQVWSIHEDRRGLLWVATSWGLARYDGQTFTSLSVPEGLPSTTVRTLLEDRAGDLWIGTNGGLARYDGRRVVVLGEPAPLQSAIWAMALDASDQVWIGTERGLMVATGGGFRSYGRADGLPGDYIYSLLVAHDGALWVGTRGGGVARCRPGPGGALADCRTFTGSDAPAGSIVRALAEDRRGRILVGTRDAGLAILEGGHWRTLRAADGLPGDDLYALLVRRTGEVVIGTDDGGLAICLDLASLRCRKVTEASGLPDNGVRALAEDRDGSLWVGTEGGLARLGDESVVSYGEQDGLPNRQVYALAEDHEHHLWVGTFRGVARLTLGPHGEPTARVWTHETGGLPGRWVWAVQCDRRGRIWIGTDGGLCRMAGDRCQPLVLGADLPADYVLAIAEDRSGALWIGGTTGVSRLSEAADGSITARRYTTADGLLVDRAYGVVVDGSDRVWVAHTEGLSWFDGRRFHAVVAGAGLPANNVRGLGLTRDGRVLAGGYGYVARIVGGAGPPRFRTWGSAAGLGEVLVMTAAELPSGRLLLGTSRGVVVLDPEADSGRGTIVARYDRDFGVVASEVSHSEAFLHGSDDRYWFGFRGALTGFPATVLEWEAAPPAATVVSLESQRGRIFRAPFTAVATTPIGWLGGAPPLLPPDDRSIRVRARAVSLRAGGNLRYQFRLEGVEESWSKAQPEPFRDYTNLDPGHYRLHVRAAYTDGPWGAPAGLDFEVRAAWWQSRAFQWLAGLLAVGAVVAAERIRAERARRRTRELEHEVAGRTDDLARYARGLAEHLRAVDRSAEWSRRAEAARRDLFARTSHELRTPLTAILGFSELLERALGARLDGKEQRYLANVRDGSEHLLRLVNNLLDQLKLEAGRMEVHCEEVDLEGMLDSVVSLMEGFALHRGVRLEIEREGELGNVRTDVAKLRQILLNLLSNAVKFSPRGERVTLAARLVEHPGAPIGQRAFELSVRDRGPGIPESERERIFEPFRQLASGGPPPAGTGLGLPIARELVELMGGVIGVDSALGHGSAFTVLLPVDPQPPSAGSARASVAGLAGSRPRLLVVEPQRRRFAELAVGLESEQVLAVRAATVEEAERMLVELRPLGLSACFDPATAGDWDRVLEVAALAARAGVPMSLLAAGTEGRGFALSLDRVLSSSDPETAARAAIAFVRSGVGGRRPVVLVAAARETGAAFTAAARRAGADAFRVEGIAAVRASFVEAPPDLLVVDADHLVRLAPDFGGGREAPNLAFGRAKAMLDGARPEAEALAWLAVRLRTEGGEAGHALAGSALALAARAALRRASVPE